MNGKLDVETHNGRVVAVWLNCQMLPFEEVDVDAKRANEVRHEVTDVITDRIQLGPEGSPPAPSVWDQTYATPSPNEGQEESRAGFWARLAERTWKRW